MDISVEEKRALIEEQPEQISLSRQCELLELSRASLYYCPRSISSLNLELMRLLDEQYTRTPFYGVARMTARLRAEGYQVNQKRVRRLLRLMGLEALYPKPHLSQPSAQHQVYPYLLKDVVIERVNQVWATDITDVRLWQGFMYLMAVMDWYSRYVLAWEVSTSLESSFCVAALDRALQEAEPEIFNSDQGSQFTSQSFTQKLLEREVKISMDGRGRVFDNIFVERLWRSVKYEEVYLKDYRSVREAVAGLCGYFEFYNCERLHQSLGYQTPEAVYRQTANKAVAATLN